MLYQAEVYKGLFTMTECKCESDVAKLTGGCLGFVHTEFLVVMGIPEKFIVNKQLVITARKWSLGQVNVFTPVYRPFAKDF